MRSLKNYKQIGSAVATLMILLTAYFASSQDSKDERGGSVLKEVAEIPLLGPAVRFDYQSFDGRLYVAHMNADHLVVFDAQRGR